MTAATAAEGVALLGSQAFDVLLSDTGVPDEDGFTFIRRVRTRRPVEGGRIPAAAITAFARPNDRDRVLAAGFQGFLSKPVNTADLVTQEYLLAGRSLTRS